jgi:hypothetical protein
MVKMAVLSREEFMNSIKTIIGDNTTDEAIKFIEDANDTINDLSAQNDEDWKTKYEENDAAWRKKYTDRFFNTDSTNDPDNTSNPPDSETEENKPLLYENLFKEEEK